jgi:hypothetical protein
MRTIAVFWAIALASAAAPDRGAAKNLVPLSSAPFDCGYIQTIYCPGCTGSVPSDSTCFCGLNGSACDCVKATGGIQSGRIVDCELGPFDYTPDPDAPTLAHDELGAICLTVKKCQKASGGALGCSTYFEGSCEMPPSSQCQWRKFSQATYQGIIVIDGLCQITRSAKPMNARGPACP